MLSDILALVGAVGPGFFILICIAVGAVLMARAAAGSLEESTRSHKLINDQFESLSTRLTDLQTKLTAEHEKREQADAQNEANERRIAALETTLADAITRAERAEAAERQANEERDTVKLANEQLEAGYKKAQKEQNDKLEAMHQSLEELKRDRDDLAQRYATELKAESNRADVAEAAAKLAHDELSVVNDRLKQVMEEVTALREEVARLRTAQTTTKLEDAAD